jgi:hypothetical protein
MTTHLPRIYRHLDLRNKLVSKTIDPSDRPNFLSALTGLFFPLCFVFLLWSCSVIPRFLVLYPSFCWLSFVSLFNPRFLFWFLIWFFIPRFLFLSLDLFFIYRAAFYPLCSFVVLGFVFLCPRFLLSSELFVSVRSAILSPFVAKLTTKMIASDQKSSTMLWQSGWITGPPGTAVKFGLWSNRSVRPLEKFVDEEVDQMNKTEWEFTLYRQL